MYSNVQYEVEIRKNSNLQRQVSLDSKEDVIKFIYKENLGVGQDDLLNGYTLYNYQTYVITFPGLRLDIKSIGGLCSFWEFANAMETGQKITSSSSVNAEVEVKNIMRTIKNHSLPDNYRPFIPPPQSFSSSSQKNDYKPQKTSDYIYSFWPLFVIFGPLLVLIGLFDNGPLIAVGLVVLLVGFGMWVNLRNH